MNIIEIKHPREIPGGKWFGYVAEPSPEAAIQHYSEKYGIMPSVVYFKRTASGKCSVYIVVEEE